MMRVNLLAPRLPSRQVLRVRRLTRAGSILLLLIAVTVGALLWVLTSQTALKSRIAAVDQALAAQAPSMAEYQSIAAQVKDAEGREETLALVPDPESHFSPLILTLDELTPPGCSLTSVVMDPEGGIAILGNATSHSALAAYIDQVRSVPDLAGAELQSATQSGGSIAFRLHAVLADAAAGAGEGGQNQ